MRHIDYTKALNQRLQWLEWIRCGRAREFWQFKSPTALQSLHLYEHALRCGDTFFMSKEFAHVVDIARHEIPNDLTFDPTWMVSPTGWMWIEAPFAVPKVTEFESSDVEIKISAIAWFPAHSTPTDPDKVTYEFVCFHDLKEFGNSEGFSHWSFFALRPGEKVIDRIRGFEANASTSEEAGAYADSRAADMLHEIRWIYTALHLMSQKLTSVSGRQADRATRRRMERTGQPITPFLKIVTLRRLEQMREREAKGETVDWSCQWLVHGHGRWQYYPSIRNHKYIWIEDYVKGPADKPMKPPQHTVFIAKR